MSIAGVAQGVHPKNTLRAVLKGKKERRLDEIILEDLITCELRLKRSQIANVYNLGKPNEWFVTRQSEKLYKSLHMVVTCEHSDYCISMIQLHVDKNGQRGHLKWVPPTIPQLAINHIMSQIAEPDTIVTTLRIGKSDKWAIDFCPNATLHELLHYLEIEIDGDTHTILLQIN